MAKEAEIVAFWDQGSKLVKDAEGRYRCVRGEGLTDAEYIAQLEGHVISKHNALVLTWKTGGRR